MDLENKTLPEPKKRGGIGKGIAIGLLAGAIGAFGVMNYDNLIVPLYNRAASGVTSFYMRMVPNSQFSKKYSPGPRTYSNSTSKTYSNSTPRTNSSSRVDPVDEMLSNIEVLPNITVKKILGKNMGEFYETTEPEDFSKEITKGVVREMTKETLKASSEAVDELSNIISSPEAREEALQSAKQTVQEVFGSPEVREAASELGKSLKGLFNTMKK